MLRLLPPNLDIDQHLAAHPPTIKGFHRDKLVHLLHLLSSIPASNRKLAERLDPIQGYVPLSSTRLRQWLSNYNDYLRYVLETGLLETDNHFVVPQDEQVGKCRGYRFAAPFRHEVGAVEGPHHAGRFVRLTDSAVGRKLRKVGQKKSLSKMSVQTRREYGHLLYWLSHIRIRGDEALRFIAQERSRLLTDPSLRKRKRKPGPNGDLVFKDPDQQYDQRFTSIVKLTEGDMSCIVDDKAGRLHTTLTNMSGKLREFIFVEGYGQLVAIDLKNSQPYLANLLLTPTFYAPFKKGRRGSRSPISLQEEGRKVWERVRETRKKDLRITLQNILQNADSEEIQKFREWTGSGEFYTKVQQALNAGGEQATFDRDDIKVMLFEVLFSKNSTKSDNKAAFAELFPTVTKVFRALKVKDHSILACLLQLLEAHLFLLVITKRINQKRSDIPLFTVHDSIVTPIEHADYVEKIMRQQLTSWVGLEPQFTRSFWGSDPANQ